MLVVMHKDATETQIKKVCDEIIRMGLIPHPIRGAQRVAIGITGNKERVNIPELEMHEGIIDIIHVTQSYKLTSREMMPDDTNIIVNGVKIGGKRIVVIAGPCAVESEKQMIGIARSVKLAGADLLRGGAFKPRTSPYSFQGLGKNGLKIILKAKKETGLPVVTEAIDTEVFSLVEEYADVIQIGARNMQNYSLLKRAGKSKKPILLKRGMASTIQEFLLAAEYIMAEGNYNIILCERGIRTFSDFTRFTLDISSIPELKRLSHLPVIADPSHASGKRDMVLPLSRASIAAGADGIMIEVHHNPDQALSDGPQSVNITGLHQVIADLKKIANAIGRKL